MNGAMALVPLGLLGALLGLDVVSFPQAMISRPIVAATAAGALVGHPSQGLLAGAVLELFALGTLPFGASRYPEWGSGAVVGGALYAAQPSLSPGALAVAMLAGLLTAWFGGWTMVRHRRLIAYWAGTMREDLARGSGDAVTTLQLRGLVSDLVRGGAVTVLSLALLAPVAGALLARWTIGAATSGGVVAALAGAVGAAAIWNVVHTTKGSTWLLLAGAAGGVAMLLAT